MAQSLYDVEAIIKKSYSLQVAVRCTTSADALCMKNQLTFCELVEPFCHLSSPGKQSPMDNSSLFIRAKISYIVTVYNAHHMHVHMFTNCVGPIMLSWSDLIFWLLRVSSFFILWNMWYVNIHVIHPGACTCV